MECAVCGESFSAKRATALYCSGRCRKRAQRTLTTTVEPPVTTGIVVPPRPPSSDEPDDEPPGPGNWEWSQAYGWVEVEPSVHLPASGNLSTQSLTPRPWDPHCYDADLHRQGVACNGCGGSFKPKP